MVVRTEVIEHHEGYALHLDRREAMLVRWLLGLVNNSIAMSKRISRECKVGDHCMRSDADNVRNALAREMCRADQAQVSCGLTYYGEGPRPTGAWSPDDF
jgi:hypothetical protein